LFGQTFHVTATSNGKSGFATVSLVSFDVSGAIAYPVPYKSTMGIGGVTFKGIGNDAKIRIYTSSGREIFSTEVTPQTGQYTWPVENSGGEKVASGVYFYVIESQDGKKDGKIIIIQ